MLVNSFSVFTFAADRMPCWTCDHKAGPSRVFKSGPAAEAIECRGHEMGRAREGDYFTLVRGVRGASSENFFYF